MKAVHRTLAFIAALLMLWIGVTGTAIQTLDLAAILSGTAETDATMKSINEGKFGNGNHSVMTEADFGADTLPAGLDIPAAFAAVQQGMARLRPGQDPDFVELRVVNGRVIGQARFGKDVRAVDAANGAEVAPVSIDPFRPPRSARQNIKELHRFWGMVFGERRPVPGVYIELASGIILLTLMITGLTMYWRLYQQRRNLKRPNPFWLAGGWWRGLHRAVAIGSSVFLCLVALSGTWLGFESSYATFVKSQRPALPAPLAAAEVPGMIKATLAALVVQEPGVPVRVIRMREYFGYRQGVVITKEHVTRQIVFDTATGRQLNLLEPGYPQGSFPFGLDVHEWAKHFHSGYLFGLPARFMSLLAGLALVYLSVSGIWMYLLMWRNRRASGRGKLFWKD